MNIAFRRRLMNAMVPVSKFTGRAFDPFVTRWIDLAEAQAAKAELCRPGLVLVSRKRLELTNLFIPGHYKHAAIVSPVTGVVVEAVGIGVTDTTLDDFLADKDEVLALEPLFCDHPTHMAEAAKWAYDQIGSSYNYSFSPYAQGVKSFWCSELCYEAYRSTAHAPSSLHFPLSQTFCGTTVLPADFVTAVDAQQFRIAWKSRRAQ